MNGSVRLEASKIRRVTTPHAPPDRYWIISQAIEPSATPNHTM